MLNVPKLVSGVKGVIGRRETMEDTHKTIDDVFTDPDVNDSIKNVSHQLIAYYGVFDGHGGRDTAIMVESLLHLNLFNNPNFGVNTIEAINRSFEETDNKVVSVANENGWANGCTAVVSLVLDNNLYTANIGDSEAILISVVDGKVVAENLTTAHKAADPEERQRILSLGGHVFFGRLFGALAVSRSFGDSRYKIPKTSQNFVSWEPSITTKSLDDSHVALILACDGLWDVLTHDEVAETVVKEIKSGKTSQQISEMLVNIALDKYSEDNITVVTVLLNWDQKNNTENETNNPENETNITENETNIPENETNTLENETNIPENETINTEQNQNNNSDI